jgi:hypothetical protein
MKSLWRKPVYLFVGICILLLCLWLTPGFAAQTVRVIRSLEPAQSALAVQKQMLNDGFIQGIVLEADAILPVPMDEARRVLFANYVQDKTQDLVVSYKELGFKEQNDPREIMADLSVSVNTPVLKKMLKDMGIFYTSLHRVSCALTLTGLQSEDWQHLEELQTLSGVDVIYGGNQSGAVTVQLNKVGENRWQGKLTAWDSDFTAQGRTLDALWSELWKNYFSLPKVMSGIFSTVTFQVAGWYVTDGASYFEDILLSWDRLVEQATLLRLDMTDADFGGVWSVQTLDVPALRTRLEAFLKDRGLHLLFFQQTKV